MYTFLIISHLVGTVIGVGAATFAEVFLVRALRDGTVDEVEGDHLKVMYTAMRIGLIITFLSGFGFLLYYRLNGLEELLYQPKLWAKMTIILSLVVNAALLHAGKMNFQLGAGISFTSWWAAVVIGSWSAMPYSYTTIIAGYIGIVLVATFLLELIKVHIVKK